MPRIRAQRERFEHGCSPDLCAVTAVPTTTEVDSEIGRPLGWLDVLKVLRGEDT